MKRFSTFVMALAVVFNAMAVNLTVAKNPVKSAKAPVELKAAQMSKADAQAKVAKAEKKAVRGDKKFTAQPNTFAMAQKALNVKGANRVKAGKTFVEGPATASISTLSSIADLEGIQITFDYDVELWPDSIWEDAAVVLENMDGSEMYAVWSPYYGGEATLENNVLTLTNWFTYPGYTSEIPEGTTSVFLEDYGVVNKIGLENYFYFETIELAYEAAPSFEGLNIECVDANATFYGSDSDWYLRLYGNSATVYLDIVSESGEFAGEWTLDDCLVDYTFVRPMGGEDLMFKSLNIVTKGMPESDFMEVTAEGVLEDGTPIRVHYLFNPVVPTDTIALGAIQFLDGGLFSEQMGGASFVLAADEEFENIFAIVWNGAIGEFAVEPASYKMNGAGIPSGYFDHGTVVTSAEQRENGLWILVDVEVVTTDAHCYTFNTEFYFTSHGEAELSYNNMSIEDLWGLFYFVDAYNDNSSIELIMYAAPEVGYEYTTDDMMISYSYVDEESGEIVEVTSIVILSAQFTEDENGQLVFDGQFIGDDAIIYTVHIFFEMPEIDDEYAFMSDELEVDDLSADLGAVQISGYNADGSAYFSLVYDTDELASEDVVPSTTYASYCQLVLNPGLDMQEALKMYDGKFHVELLGDGRVSLSGSAQCGHYLVTVDATGEVSVESDCTEYDGTEDVEVAFATADVEAFQVDAEEGYAYVRVSNGTDVAAVLIYIEGDDLPAGVYEINETFEPGSVQAGELSGNSIYPAFYGTLDEEGYVSLPLYVLVAGTVTIDYDAQGELVMLVDATNPCGAAVKLSVNAPKVGINNTTVDATSKRLVNGQLVIERAGKRYNATGVEF